MTCRSPPRELVGQARRAGLHTQLHAVTYAWRRLPARMQRLLHPVDRALGSRERTATLGHTLLMIGRKG